MSSRTRIESIENFLNESRVSIDGYGNHPDEEVDIYSTFYALEISNILGFEVNDSLDILYYIQRLQNDDGGFGETESSSSSLDATIIALKALKYLSINSSQILPWNIYPYINETIFPKLYTVSENTTEVGELTNSRMKLWLDYIIISAQLGILPEIPVLDLITELHNLQNSNGTYANLELAIYASILLNLLGEAPNDADLAIKFILAHVQTDGIFAFEQGGTTTINATRWALDALEALNAKYELQTSDTIIRYILNLQQSNSGFGETGGANMEITWIAINILSELSAIEELFAPDVLQEVGFVDFTIQVIPVAIIGVILLRRRHI